MSIAPDLRDQWFPAPGTAAPPYAAKHRIAADLRSVVERLVGLDVDGMAAADLAALEADVSALRQRLEALPDRRHKGSLATQPPPEGTLVERSPVSGRANVLAVPLTYRFDGEITTASAVFSSAYEGPPGGVHGGYVAAAFDELLGVAQMATGLAGFTGTLTVRYRALTPVEEVIDFEAGPGQRDGRKLTMWARARAAGEVVAEAEGVFIAQIDVSRR